MVASRIGEKIFRQFSRDRLFETLLEIGRFIMKRTAARWTIAAIASLFATSASASFVLELRVEELTKRADEVVRARVLERQSRWSEDGHSIHTFTTLEVISNLKGQASGLVTVRQLGGEVDGVGSFVSGDAHFEVGEEVIVFLRANPDGEPVFHLIGLGQGKFRVDRSGESVRVVRDNSELALMRVVGDRFVPGDHGGLTDMSLEELVGAIGAAANEE